MTHFSIFAAGAGTLVGSLLVYGIGLMKGAESGQALKYTGIGIAGNIVYFTFVELLYRCFASRSP